MFRKIWHDSLPWYKWIPLIPFKAGLEELVPYRGRFRADAPERTASVLMAGFVILGPIVGLGISFGLAKPEGEVLHPLINLISRLKDETPNKATETHSDLCGVDDNSFDGSSKGDLRGDG